MKKRLKMRRRFSYDDGGLYVLPRGSNNVTIQRFQMKCRPPHTCKSADTLHVSLAIKYKNLTILTHSSVLFSV